jgi:hypothetical protein
MAKYLFKIKYLLSANNKPNDENQKLKSSLE